MSTIIPPLPDIKFPNRFQAFDNPPGETNPPTAIPVPAPLPSRFVRSGAWLINYLPTASTLVAYDGTIRVQNDAAGWAASGDLYQRPVRILPFPVLFPPPNPAGGIPIQGRRQYRYYVRVTKMDEFAGSSFDLGFQLYKYQETSSTAFTFTLDGDFTAKMIWMVAPAGSGYPSSLDYAEGDVKNSAGTVVGRLKMGWVSLFYRKCTVEIDTVAGSQRPLNNGAGQDWQTVFQRVGFELNVKLSDINVAEPSGPSWSNAELHSAMLARRDPIDLDKEWHYYILAVKQLDEPAFGIMFDVSSTDSNSTPREGVGISSHTVTPRTPPWGVEGGRPYGTATAAYFRTAIHELGHAFGLLHNVLETDNSFMNRTNSVVNKATPITPFPTNIKWNYADENLLQLRHWPDIFVRPGGVAFGPASDTNPPISHDLVIELQDLEFEVESLLDVVPLGAPVRVNIKLTNKGQDSVLVPSDISLKSGYLSGTVTDTSGTTRSFKSLICHDTQDPFTSLGPNESISASLTLLRGGQGPLFPTNGVAEIAIKLDWNVADGAAVGFVTGNTTVLITPPADKSHAAAAHKLLTTSDTHLVLVLGGDHLKDGIGAILQALEDKTLRPHFACIEARRQAQRFFDRAADVKSASKLIDGEVVMSPAERAKLEKLGVKCK